MAKVFYDHLTVIEEVFFEIDTLTLSASEKKQAKKLIDDLFHHEIINFILTLLPQPQHQEFLVRFHKEPFSLTHIEFLTEKVGKDMSSEIVVFATKLKKKLKKDLKNFPASED